jgi:hypothetical protein
MERVVTTSDIPWEFHLRTLVQKFTDSAAGQCLLWINPAQRDPFVNDPSLESRKVRVPILHPRFDLRFAPYLIPLDLSSHADEDLFRTSVQLAWEAWTPENLRYYRGQSIAGWVATDKNPTEVARHWGTCTHLHVHRGFRKLLRFHDPSVREWLWPTLNTRQQRQLLGPAISLSAVDRGQNLMHQVARPPDLDPYRTEPAAELTSQRLTLTQHQWEQIEDYAIVHAAWTEWCSQITRMNGEAPPHPEWQREIFPALACATRYGITHPQDRELFAIHALQLGGRFHTNEKMQSVWKKTLAGDFYANAIEEVSGRKSTELEQYLIVS